MGLLLVVILSVIGRGVFGSIPSRPPVPGTEECRHPQPPNSPPKCGSNAHFELCPKLCPRKYCSSLWSDDKCTERECCYPMCVCDDGYLKDDKTGICKTVEECLYPCGKNQHFARDHTRCLLTCANWEITDPYSHCKPYTGCVCNDGYARLNDNATGICVKIKDTNECPSKECPCNEHWVQCKDICPDDTCASHVAGYNCTNKLSKCESGCVCNDGYLRNQYQRCVPKIHCPYKNCSDHERWDSCPKFCPRDSCAKYNQNFKCPQLPAIPLHCQPDCVCKSGFLRNPKGLCVPVEQCPTNQTCGVNEIEVECRRICPPQTCESIYALYNCKADQPCEKGCDCRPGYLRDKYGQCILSEQCPGGPPSTCGPNQEYKKCGTSCPDTCDTIHKEVECGDVCVKGCFCVDGYVEDQNENCIPVDKCPPPQCDGENEVYKVNASVCEYNCETCRDSKLKCDSNTTRTGCFCKNGYVRNQYNKCVLPNKCSSKPQCLLEHEKYLSCGSGCPITCDNYRNKNSICTLQCVPGCFCEDGYVRDKSGLCVKSEQCPKVCGHNEEYNYCGSYCPLTCSNRFAAGDWACIALCRSGCECISGTLRNDSGVCVPVNECTLPRCNENEEYNKCGTACPVTCDNYNDTCKECTLQCVEGCFCKKDYVRDDSGRCVRPEQCSKPICGKNEVLSDCAITCPPQTCESPYTDYACEVGKPCKPGCNCISGYFRNSTGICIPSDQCPPPNPCAQEHEEWSDCSAHCQRTCEDKDGPLTCPPICLPGCVCAADYVKDANGNCIPKSDCKICPKDERWVQCEQGYCVPKNCGDLGFPVDCPDIKGPCKGGCVCDEGLVRNCKGVCIPKEKCPSCGGDSNATIGCANYCGNSCSDYNNASKVCPPGCQYNGCSCKKGFVYDDIIEKCISPEECPTSNTTNYNNGSDTEKICPINEEWVDCPANICKVKYCSDLGYLLNCSHTDEPCSGGCLCKTGYLRNKKGLCVPIEKCPNCGGDRNATTGCGNYCGQSCSDYQDTKKRCVLSCIFNSCKCREGYIYHEVLKECVLPKDCPQPCEDPNAERVSCATHCPATCADPIPPPCPYAACTKYGCNCKSGYILNKRGGHCVLIENCPANLGCNGDTNATIKKCPTPCPRTCQEPRPKICNKLCPNVGCECNAGYFKNGTRGQCIKLEDCKDCGVNSTFVYCNAACPSDYCPKDDSRAIIACMPPNPCPSGCRCKADYRRNNNDEKRCILASECPPVKCTRANEVWDACPDLEDSCKDIDNHSTKNKPSYCRPQCVCKNNYFRNDNDACVPASECSSNHCGPLEEYLVNTEACHKTCYNRVITAPPSKCQPSTGCFCKSGYVRMNKSGSGPCVLPERCPNK